MEVAKKRADETKPRTYRDQLITIGDLEIFRHELLEDIKGILASGTNAPVKKWLKSSEVRKLLGVSIGTLQNLRVNGSLSFSKVGGIIFYDYNEIAKLLKDNEQR